MPPPCSPTSAYPTGGGAFNCASHCDHPLWGRSTSRGHPGTASGGGAEDPQGSRLLAGRRPHLRGRGARAGAERERRGSGRGRVATGEGGSRAWRRFGAHESGASGVVCYTCARVFIGRGSSDALGLVCALGCVTCCWAWGWR